jgi:holo-[acyl-carrier protein] synthase
MVVGIGLDFVETQRLARAPSLSGRRFAQPVFTSRELAECVSPGNRLRPLAARFAAKDACFKALGAAMRERVSLREGKVVPGKNGALQPWLTGALAERGWRRGVRHAPVSLSHELRLAAAGVVLAGDMTRVASRADRHRAAAPWTVETLSRGTW